MTEGYLQCYVVTMESGAVVLCRVIADNRPRGIVLAKNLALIAVDRGAIWDCCAYPQGDAERKAGQGFDILKPYPAQ